MFEILNNSIINELIIKENLNFQNLLLFRMSCKSIYNFTDIYDKDNNEYLWKFYYLKNQLNNYKILPDSINLCVERYTRYDIRYNSKCFYDWLHKIYYKTKINNYYYNTSEKLDDLLSGRNVNINNIDELISDEEFKNIFGEKLLYTKYLMLDCYIKNKDNTHKFFVEIFNFWVSLGKPCVRLDHYDLNTCCFNCKKKGKNYKCFFKEILKRTKTKYKKFISMKANNEEVIERQICSTEKHLEYLKLELESKKKHLKKIKDYKININTINKFLLK